MTARKTKPRKPAAVTLRASESVNSQLLAIRHAMELQTGKPVGMREVADHAIQIAFDTLTAPSPEAVTA